MKLFSAYSYLGAKSWSVCLWLGEVGIGQVGSSSGWSLVNVELCILLIKRSILITSQNA
jgi:hypothetical protein